MGNVRTYVPDPKNRVAFRPVSKAEVRQLARNLVRFNNDRKQVSHYKAGEKPTTLLEFLGMIFVVCLGAGFVLFFGGWLPQILKG